MQTNTVGVVLQYCPRAETLELMMVRWHTSQPWSSMTWSHQTIFHHLAQSGSCFFWVTNWMLIPAIRSQCSYIEDHWYILFHSIQCSMCCLHEWKVRICCFSCCILVAVCGILWGPHVYFLITLIRRYHTVTPTGCWYTVWNTALVW